MSQEAKYANGESVLSQARPAQNIEWAWADGESGDIGADEYVAPVPGPQRKRMRRIG